MATRRLADHRDHLQNPNLHVFGVDFRIEQSINGCISEIEDKLGVVHTAVNCVGILGKNGMKAEDVDIEDFDLVYQINLRGALIGMVKSIGKEYATTCVTINALAPSMKGLSWRRGSFPLSAVSQQVLLSISQVAEEPTYLEIGS